MYEDNKTLRDRVVVHQETNDMLNRSLGLVPGKWIFGYARVVADQKGYDRINSQENLKYVWTLMRVTIASLVRWRQFLSVRAVKSMTDRGVGLLRNALRRIGT